MNLARRISFFDQLATLTAGGVPLRQSFDRLTARFKEPPIALVRDALAHGSDAAESFQSAKFSPFEVKLIAAGERSGRLDESFRQLAAYWKTEQGLVGALWKHMAYPIILLHVIALLGPIKELVFGSMLDYFFAVTLQLGGLYAVAFGIFWIARETWRSEAGQAFWLHVPLVGRFWRATYTYRWIVALRMELNAGFSFAQSISDAWEATGFSTRAQRAEEARERIARGETLASLLTGWNELPEDWTDYFATAEFSGKIHETLGQVEAVALEEWKRAQERLADWAPKILYFVLVLFGAFQVFQIAFATYGKVMDGLDSVLE